MLVRIQSLYSVYLITFPQPAISCCRSTFGDVGDVDSGVAILRQVSR